MQQHVFTLVGRAAKFKGMAKNWQRNGVLYWQGEPINRFSEEYQLLLDEAFRALFTQNASARAALLASGDAVLQHSIGKAKEKDTVLTRGEFCSRLTRIREELKRANRQ
jgi:hypothetical protein